jgi:hypothetical protein
MRSAAVNATSRRRSAWGFFFAWLALLAVEVLRVYWIMPFPGSQVGETLGVAYALHRCIWLLRALLGATALWHATRLLAGGRWKSRVFVPLALALFALVAYQTNGPMSADVMFRQPGTLRIETAERATLDPQALVVGVALEPTGSASGQSTGRPGPSSQRLARAYPIQFIGYHHQVRDTVAGRPIMVTYCTVCRTGRVFSPILDGVAEEFRLVGMDHWNAMFEDGTTGSWWRQATGEAVAGERKGKRLEEIPSAQMTWAAWKALHPESEVMEPDPAFADRYARMKGFAEGTNKSALTGRDPESWKEKSWVVGVLADRTAEAAARAFDWNDLVKARVIQDRVGDRPIVLLLAADGESFQAFDARPAPDAAPLALEPTSEPDRFKDTATGASWSDTGLALTGPHAGVRLEALPAYQEFWHSWRTFHPTTTARGGGIS